MTGEDRVYPEIEKRFQRDLSTIALPTEDTWVPKPGAERPNARRQWATAMALGATAVVLGLVAGDQLRERLVPAGASPLPLPSAVSPGPAIVDPGRAGLFVKPPPSAASWDLIYSVSRTSAAGWTTDIYRIDPSAPVPRLTAVVQRSSKPPAIFAAPNGSIYAFGPERSQVFRLPGRFQGPGLPVLSAGSEGPPLDAISMHFVGDRAFVTTSVATFALVDSDDLARFPALNKIADAGGELLGELQDGRLLLASTDDGAGQVTVRAVRTDGQIQELLVVPGGRGPSAAPTGTVVFTVRDDPPGPNRGMVAVVGWDLRTAQEVSTQLVGSPNNLSVAMTHRAPGYLFTDPKAFFASGEYAGLVPIGARGAAGGNWDGEATRGRLPMLDVKLSWSPDDAYIAFSTGTQHAVAIPNEFAPRPATAEGLALYGSDKRRILELDPEAGAVVRVAGWAAR